MDLPARCRKHVFDLPTRCLQHVSVAEIYKRLGVWLIWLSSARARSIDQISRSDQVQTDLTAENVENTKGLTTDKHGFFTQLSTLNPQPSQKAARRDQLR
jgi:hypothetical protein